MNDKRILVVDDSPTYLHATADRLRDEGYQVLRASSGQEALTLLGSQPVDAILMDLVMEGLSGLEACQRIKGEAPWRDIPLIVLTARPEEAALLDSMHAGADDYVTKNAGFEVLLARLKAQLRRRHHEVENIGYREQLVRQELWAEEQGSFSYSVSHDLRAPLRGIEGFSRALQEDCGEALSPEGKRHLERILAGVARMERLIDDMLGLAMVSGREMSHSDVDLSSEARGQAAELGAPDGPFFRIQPGMRLQGDRGLVRILLQNLMGNAWKFSSTQAHPLVEVFNHNGVNTVRDNGVGFDMAYADKLFKPFQRLHAAEEFPGSGIGLATAQRVANRHGGRLWAESKPGLGSSFHFSW